MNQLVRADASASTRGTVYQLWIAVERCYTLKPGQKLLVEELGDVTILGETQVEVKQYTAPLTDGHANFWNTIFNWTDSKFDSSQYQALVLHTTQIFGERSRLSSWNDAHAEARIEILNAIHLDLEAEFEARNAKKLTEPSKTLRQQRVLISGDRRAALETIIGKVIIEAGASGLSNLYHHLCRVHAFHILDSNCQQYMNSLLGFVCRSGKAAGESWEISFEDFRNEVHTLTSIFRSESREFPRAEFERVQDFNVAEARDDLFVQKIRDIGCDGKFVVRAITDFEGTVATIAQEFRQYTAAHGRLRSFQGEVEGAFEASYSLACLSPPLDDPASKKFYLNTTVLPPPNFPGYADSPSSFRNGLLHLMMDEDERDCVWRLRDE